MSTLASVQSLSAALEKEGAPRVVAAVGPESFLQQQVLDSVAVSVLGSADSPALLVLQGAATSSDVDDETVARFFDETRTGSLFGGAKVVVLRNAEGVVSRHRKAFLAWLESPGTAAVAVLLAAELPKTVEDALGRTGLMVRCGGRGGRTAVRAETFAAQRASRRGKRLGRAEADLLVELLGRDLATLDAAVEVLALHAGEREAVLQTDIDALFQSAREGSVWSFGDLLVGGDVAGALAEAERCFAEGIPDYPGSRRVTRGESSIALRLVSAFTTSACRTLAVRDQLDAGVARSEVQIPGRVPASARRVTLSAASSRRRRALEAMVLFAEETDRGLKSGGPTGRVAIARLSAAVGRLP